MLGMVVTGVYVVVCLLLVLIVLLQQGKGGDVAAAFGGGGGTQAAFGARSGATVLTRATTVLGAMFMVGALVLAIMGQQEPGSVVSGVESADVNAAETVPAPPAGGAPNEEPQ